MNEKKNLRFNSLDCFILILILIVGGSFLLKAQLANLFAGADGMQSISYQLRTEETAVLEQLRPGEELRDLNGASLGTVTSLEERTEEGKKNVYCTLEASAVRTEQGYRISGGALLIYQGNVSISLEGQTVFAVVTDIREN